MSEYKLTVRVPAELRRRIEALAEQRGSSLTAVVNEALEEYLGLIGAIAPQSQTGGEQDWVAGQSRSDRLFAPIDRTRDAILARRDGRLLEDPAAMLDTLREEGDARGLEDFPHHRD